MITRRSIVTGLICCFLLGVGEPLTVLLIKGSPLCADYSTGAAVFLFFLLVFVMNGLMRLFSPRAALKPTELITVYILMIVACAIPSWGFVMNLIGMLGGVYYYADGANRWAETIHPHLPHHLFPKDPQAILHLYEGLPKGAGIPWKVWVQPLGNWFLFILVFYVITICLMVMLRKQWVEKERLTYPMTELPRTMAQEPIFRNPLLWTGFAIPFVLYSLRGLHAFFPMVPAPTLRHGVPIFGRSFGLQLCIFWEVIGLAFFMANDVLLSVWLFALLFGIETGFLNRIGYSIGPVQPFSGPAPQVVACQNLGALLVLSISCLWVARVHLKQIFRSAIGRREQPEEPEILPHRAAFWMFVVGFLYCAYWFMTTGLRPFTAVFFLTIALLIFVGLARIIASAGLAYYRAPVIPAVATVDTFGSSFLGIRGLSALGMTFCWAADIRTLVMASMANGLKLSTEFRINARRLFFAILGAVAITLVSTAWCTLLLGYRYGGINLGGFQFQGLGRYPMMWITSFLQKPVGFGGRQMGFTALGGVFMLLLLAARGRFLWWPISPIGMAVGMPYPVYYTWFSVFLSWVVKALIMKYGGIHVYRKTKPFFLGLILGAFVTAGIWIFVGYFTHKPNLSFTLG